MKELIKYLLDNLYIDFQGEITLETVRSFLREDDGTGGAAAPVEADRGEGRRRDAHHAGRLPEGAHPEPASTSRRSASSSRCTPRAEPLRPIDRAWPSRSPRSRLLGCDAGDRVDRARYAAAARRLLSVRASTGHGDLLRDQAPARKSSRNTRSSGVRSLSLPTSVIRQAICLQRHEARRSTRCVDGGSFSVRTIPSNARRSTAFRPIRTAATSG